LLEFDWIVRFGIGMRCIPYAKSLVEGASTQNREPVQLNLRLILLSNDFSFKLKLFSGSRNEPLQFLPLRK